MNIVRKYCLRFGVVTLIIIFGLNISYAQENSAQTLSIEEYLSNLPANLTLKENTPQKYRLTTNWHNRDLNGNATGKFIISGEYTRAVENQNVRWNNVQIEVFRDPIKPDSDTLFQEWMEGFSYKSPDDIAKPDIFNNFPADETTHLLRTLIWDAVTFEAFAWTYFDKLMLNESIGPSDFEDITLPMSDWGTIKMKGLKLSWIGVSKINDEICALIQYESFVNPVKSLGVSGRSLYWGSIWVSLEDKQIEYAKLNEDVNMELMTSPQSKKYLNIQREVELKKIK